MRDKEERSGLLIREVEWREKRRWKEKWWRE